MPRLPLLVLLFAFVTFHPTDAIGQTTAPPGSGQVLRSGDLVKVAVWNSAELSGEFEVNGEGALKHPLYNRLVVSGVALPELRERFAKFLADYQKDPRFEIEPLFRVMVGGEVRSPNVYNLPPEVTIADAIARAGGPTPNGSRDRIVVRRGSEQLKLSVETPGAEGSRMLVRSGDQIIVPEHKRFFTDRFMPAFQFVMPIVSLGVLLTR